jgi:hypothetical protein
VVQALGGTYIEAPTEILLLLNRNRLIAIMLGRLEMNIDDCIDAFSEMMDEIFHQKHILPFRLSGNVRERYSSDILEKCIKKVIKDAGFSPDAKLRGEKVSKCKVYVFTLGGIMLLMILTIVVFQFCCCHDARGEKYCTVD